jgi:hypothetical protein
MNSVFQYAVIGNRMMVPLLRDKGNHRMQTRERALTCSYNYDTIKICYNMRNNSRFVSSPKGGGKWMIMK